MISFRHLSIKHKLTLLSVLASGSALILACGAFVVYDGWVFRDTLVQTIATQAKIVGANSAAALVFSEPRSATETLAALSAEPHVIAAGIYTGEGKLFASYARDKRKSEIDVGLPQISPAQLDQHRFQADHLDLSRQIRLRGEVIGIVAIRADLEAMRVRQRRYLGIAGAVLVISTLGAILVSLWFRQRISHPILALAAIAAKVSRAKDYSVRATVESRDEIGQLVETFNGMLSRIQEQNQNLHGAQDKLEQRVIERTAELEAANKELEAFSYSVSHDLRAPLRSIDGFSQALLEDYGDKLDAQGQSDLRRVRAASQRMAQLIDDMLGLARVTRDEMRREDLDLSDLVREIAAEIQTTQPDRQMDFAIAKSAKANGDVRLLGIVLENLLRNAWKFTGKRPHGKIEFGIDPNNGTPVYFIRDNGAGFDMTYSSKLFGVFQRLHDMTEFKGTGIGLATVQRIIRRHGGRVWAEGKVEEGATFYFTLSQPG
jgi:signal transduction histidine kinase